SAHASGDGRPLLGIPVTLKEPFNIAGLPTTWGYSEFRHFVPSEGTLVVSRLKAAGAGIIGNNNNPSLRRQLQQQWRAFFSECDVALYPSAAVPVPHDHSEPIEDRHLDIEGKAYPYYDACFIWADPASTCGLPATAEIDRSATGLPIEV